ncbi:opine metallophore biosynthesis dehydrogenase [Paenibacillus wulumuqiensis]|uniref:opine metallophore biosynthesis dehydrogenase n=1 Tax=Paenibacillus wulumuqiensis TaxID=1567107 RepID=UPI000619691B|nr:opine metallophore biosynthesis dehydrogenase [Paenibacillus wulumuqiensis]
MKEWGNVLILGTGPVSVQLAVMLKQQWNSRIGIAGRRSSRSQKFFASLEQSDRQIRVGIQNEQHHSMAGECRVDEVFSGYEHITGQWDTLLLAVTTDAYTTVLKQIAKEVLHNVQCIVLISPTFGSGNLVHHYIKEFNPRAEVISFSTYHGDTRWAHQEPSHTVLTTAVKKKLCAGSVQKPSARLDSLQDMYTRLGVQLQLMDSPLEAETRNISLYVHPPLFMNEVALEAVFGEDPIPRYVYKLYPEGPITQQLIRSMLAQWQEITAILKQLNITGINLLKFMTDDNYPVLPASLGREDIENFNHLPPIHQEYLLYVRYASLLIDPFSESDSSGRYFDFSAVPFRKVFTNQEGQRDIPRMPQEDYYRIKIIQGISHHTGTPCPVIDEFVHRYESTIREYARNHPGGPLSRAFTVQDFHEDLTRICGAIQPVH